MRTRSTTGSSVRRKGRFAAVTAVACATALSAAPAALGTGASAAKARHSHSKTVVLGKMSTQTIDVGYPEALQFRNAKYSCSVKVTGPAARKVKILFHGSAKGGTVCRVKARNNSTISGLDGTANVKVTATTVH
jgi:hypothetical protein